MIFYANKFKTTEKILIKFFFFFYINGIKNVFFYFVIKKKVPLFLEFVPLDRNLLVI